MTPLAILAFARQWWKAAAGLVLGFLLCWPVASCSGRHSEAAEWRAAMAKVQALAVERARQADNQRTQEVGAANHSIATARQELDNATRNLPDEATTARRRARICAELREQARRASAPAPAC